MADRKLTSFHFSKEEEELYTFAVMKYLRGERDYETIEFLKRPYQLLIRARFEIADRNLKEGMYLLGQISEEDEQLNLVKIDRNFLAGMCHYHGRNFTLAESYFSMASKLCKQDQRINRYLICQFNLSQCLTKLGRVDEASRLDQEVLMLAEEIENRNVIGICQRSIGYFHLRNRDLETSLAFFQKSVANLSMVGNMSDAGLSGAYAMLLEMKLEKITLSEFARSLDLEKYWQATPIMKRLSFHLKKIFIERDLKFLSCLKDYEEDLVELIAFVLKGGNSISKNIVVGNKSKGRGKLESQLLKILEDGPKALEQCIETLWPNEQNWVYLKKRFHTLVYRINLKQKVIQINQQGLYQKL